jgi:hypothetical protein
MRAREFTFLTEAQNYEQMFAGVLKILPEEQAAWWRETSKHSIKLAKELLRKNDRIAWYLKWVRLDMLNELVGAPGFNGQLSKQHPEIADTLKDLRSKIMHKMGWTDMFNIPRAHWIHAQLTHFMGIVHNVPAIQNHVFRSEKPAELFDIFREHEKKWAVDAKGTVDIREDDHEIIKLDQGSWWLLNRSSCPSEADAMGHCGNAGGYKNHRILSFRSLQPNNRWKPHLTFIIDEDGYLGETKGRANEKPAERYHPYIIKLLEHKMVKGISGGGYQPENNFALSDLPEQERERLIQAKPDLGTLKDMLRARGPSKEVLDRVLKTLDSHDISYVRVEFAESDDDGESKLPFDKDQIKDYSKALIVLDEDKDLETFANYQKGNLSHYVGVVQGDYDQEHYVDPDQVKDFVNELPDNLTQTLKDKMRVIADNNGEDLDEWINMNDGDIWETIDQYEDMEGMDDIRSAVHWATETGVRYGYETEVYNAIKRELNDPTLPYGGRILFTSIHEPVKYVMPLYEIVHVLSDEDMLYDIEYTSGWYGDKGINLDDGRYGFHGDFQEEGAREDLEQRLYDI